MPTTSFVIVIVIYVLRLDYCFAIALDVLNCRPTALVRGSVLRKGIPEISRSRILCNGPKCTFSSAGTIH